MGGTLYAAMGMHSYILTIICCGAQVSFLPTTLLRMPKFVYSEFSCVSGHSASW